MQEIRYTSRGLRKRGKGNKWEVTLSHRDPETGKVIPTYHTIAAKNERQALKERDRLILDLERKGAATGSKMTIEEWLGKYVDYKERSGTVQASTVCDYRKCEKAINLRLGSVHLGELTIADVNEWMAKKLEDGYAPKTIVKEFRLLKQALKHAVGQELLMRNVCDFCKPPRCPKQKVNSLDKAERSRMLKLAREAEPDPLALAIEIALMTGMRRGEICALRWSDLGDDGTITVNRALGNKDGSYYVKETKTVESLRTIPLTQYLYKLLCAMRAKTQSTMKRIGLPMGDFFILGTQEPDSKPYAPSRLTHEFHAFCRMHGFSCTFHDLRHTFATMMVAQNADVRTVASYLGHSSVAMTLNTYTDVDPDAKRAAVQKIVDAFDENVMNAFDFVPEAQIASGAEEPGITLTFTVEQLERMLEEARKREQDT